MLKNFSFGKLENKVLFDIAISRILPSAIGKSKYSALLIYEPNPISLSQIYPFLHYRKKFTEKWDVSFRYVSVSEFLENDFQVPDEITHVLFQTWITNSRRDILRLFDKVKSAKCSRKLVFLDSFANSDLRFLNDLCGIDFYYKKSLFRDTERFFDTTRGHTNLSDYYGEMYGLEEAVNDWQVPRSMIAQLRLSPNFLTDPSLMEWLLAGEVDSLFTARREIDVHARLGGTEACGWYGEMRRDANRRVRSLSGAHVVSGTGISQRKFRKELHKSKICFSPFGYGEVCWRDIEAIASGAVLLKPDMSHLRTEPDLYVNEETYVAIQWDFSDLQQKVTDLLADEDRRTRIARNAWNVARSYLRDGGAVAAYCDVFDDKV